MQPEKRIHGKRAAGDPVRIALVTMPFASPATPSIALTQLKAVLDQRFSRSVEVSIVYANLEFARLCANPAFYNHVMSNVGFCTGFGDWFFAAAAFPDAPDTTQAYLDMYYPKGSPISATARDFVAKMRPRIGEFLDTLAADPVIAEADIVGFTTIFGQTTASIALARLLKERKPGPVTLLGGPACAADMGMALARHADPIDYVFSGCALVSLPDFVGHWTSGDIEACEQLDGVFSKRTAARWRRLDMSPVGRELDSPPSEPQRKVEPCINTIAPLGQELDVNVKIPLDYSDYLDSLARALPAGSVQPRLLVETSRGCAWGEAHACAFCGLNGPDARYRAMKSAAAVDLIRGIVERHPACTFISSVDNLMPASYPETVFPRLHLPATHKMQYEVRVNLQAKELAALAENNVLEIQPGIEALDTETLRRMRKGTTAFQNLVFLKRCAKLPLTVAWNLLIGTPGEPDSVYEKYLTLFPRLHHLPPPLWVFPVEFVRYSHYWRHPADYGLDLQPDPYYALTYPFDKATLEELAHRFVDNNADVPRLHNWLERLGEAVETWRERWLGSDGLAQARLGLITGNAASCLIDTRSGRTVRYTLTPAEHDLLRQLDDEPHTIAQLAEKLPHLDAKAIGAAGSNLESRGLLFREGSHALSLVVG